MSFIVSGRASEQVGLPSHSSITNRTNLVGNGSDSAGDGSVNGNGHGNGNGHLNGNGHSYTNGNGHVNGNGRSHTNGNGHANGNGHSHTNDNGPVNGNGQNEADGNGQAYINGRRPNRFQPLPATLSAGVSIKGTIKFRSELVIDGEIEGTIESIGRLTVGPNAHVRGDIRTRSVTVHGTVDGNLSAEQQCELRSGCILRGDIETARLVMDEDVSFTGSAAIATRDYLAEMRCPNGKPQS